MSDQEFEILDSEQACRAFTRETLNELQEAGAELETVHLIEHHLFSVNFDNLEKAVVELVKKGYEVDDADEVELDDGNTGYCCDILIESPLQQDAINQQTDVIYALVDKFNLEYDGWGTYLPELDDEEDYENENEDEGDDAPVIH
ncbi:ribonuclease E inhibitor RraB [Aliidiomarina minuta]|nr:ribonuclease E inhibitor RraB [Aliidiomarina minuta]